MATNNSYPTWLKANPLHQAAFNSLDSDSPARTSRKAFNSFFYKKCETCSINVFSYLHEERCRPILVQASILSDCMTALTITDPLSLSGIDHKEICTLMYQLAQPFWSCNNFTNVSQMPLVDMLWCGYHQAQILIQSTLNVTTPQLLSQIQAGQQWNTANFNPVGARLVNNNTEWLVGTGPVDLRIRISDGFEGVFATGTDTVISPFQLNPNRRFSLQQRDSIAVAPSALSLFNRYSTPPRDDLTDVAGAGMMQRIERTRNDVRHIEEKLDLLRPIILAIQNNTAAGRPPTGEQGSTGGGSTGLTFPSTGPTGGSIPINLNTPLPPSSFPMTLEGQIARILQNQRIMAANNGVIFQASLELIPNDVAISLGMAVYRRVLHFTEYLVDGQPIPAIVPEPHPRHPTTMTVFARSGGVTVSAGNDRMVVEGSPGQLQMRFSNIRSGAFGSGGSPPVTDPQPPAGDRPDSGSQNQQMSRVLRNLATLMGATGVVFVQASVERSSASIETTARDASMTIADVDQVLEDAKDSVSADPPMEEQLNELDRWTIKNVLSRPTLVSRVIWDQQGANTELMNVSFPNQWLTNLGKNTHFNNMLNAFSMMKADVVFRLVANSTSMYGGVLAMPFDFYGRLHSVSPFTANQQPVLDRVTVSNCDPVYLDLSANTVCEMTVPFSAVSQYLSRQHGDLASQFMGTLSVHTMSTLYRPPQAAGVELRLYAYVEAPAVAVLQEPDARPFVVPQANIVKAITSFAHSFIPRMEDVYPLALEEGYHVKRESTCRVEDIGSVYGLAASAQWQTSTADGSELFRIPVHPMVNTKMAVAADNFIATSRLGHLGRHYCYWNGTLEYRLQVACSASHVGKLYIVFHSGPDYQGGDVIETNAHILLDVQKIHELEFSVPFSSPTPWKPTYLFQPFGDIARTSTGSIHIISADGIKSALSPNSTITVNLYVRAGKDFQYAVPRNGLQGTSRMGETITQVSLTSLRPSLKMNSEDFNDLYKVLRRFTPVGSPIRTAAGEAFVIPVRPILPRSFTDNSLSEIAAGFGFWRGSLSYKFKVTDATNNRAAFEVYHCPTLGIPSGMGADDIAFPVAADSIGGRSGSGSFYGSQTFHGDIDKEWEVTVPYYSMYDHLHIPLKHYQGGADNKSKLPLLSTNNGCIVIRPLLSRALQGNTAYGLAVSISCGQDFTLLAPTSFPLVKARSAATIANDVRVTPQATLEPEKEEDVEVQGLFSFFDDLQKSMNNLEALSSLFREDVAQDSKEYITGILETVVVRLAERAKLSASSWFKRLIPDCDWKLLASALITSAVLYKFRDGSLFSMVVIASLSSLVSHKIIGSLTTFVKGFVDPQISAQYGVGLDLTTITQLCCGVIAVFLNFDMRKGVNGLVKNLGELGKSLAGIKSGTEAIKRFSEFVNDNVVPSLGDDDSLTLKSLMVESVDILEEVYLLNTEEMRVACFSENMIKDRVLKCDGRLQELNRLVLMNHTSPAIINALTRAMARMDKLRNEVMKYKGEEGYRVDPFHVSIYGPPKVGKSAAMKQIADDLVAFNDFPTTNQIYPRSVDSVYWDGYMGQTVVCFDDLGQIENPAPPSDLSELINLKSNQPYPVHMADLTQKGTYFTSKLIVSSTNFMLYNTCPFVKSKDALHRRRDVLVEMQPKEVDPVTGLIADGQHELGLEGPNGYARFRILNSINAAAETEWMSYDELITIVAQRSRDHFTKQNKLVADHSRRVTPSATIQALLAGRDETVPVVALGQETVVVDADAQGLLDSMTPENARQQLNIWREQFLNAVKWRDFGAMASGLSPASRSRICREIRRLSSSDFCVACTGPCEYPNGHPKTPGKILIQSDTIEDAPLSRVERRIVMCWMASRAVQKRSADLLNNARDGIAVVGAYFNDLYNRLPADKRKYLATALVSLGALGVGLTLYSFWQRTRDPLESNIPKEIFSEGSDDYKMKDRSQPLRKKVVMESGIDDYKTMRTSKQRIFVESGIDDHKTMRGQRKIVIESAQDFARWSAENPGLIPYKYLIDEEASAAQKKLVMTENPTWADYDEFCQEQGQSNRWTLPKAAPGYRDSWFAKAASFFGVVPESGIDDYKTARGQRKVLIEADLPNPMTLDVPATLMALSEDDLLREMTATQAIGDRKVVDVPSDTCNYRMIEAAPQYTADQQCVQLMRSKLIDNVGFIMHDKSGFRMRCLVVDDRFIALPKHFFLLTAANWQEGDIFRIWIRGKLYEQAFHQKALYCWANRDLCLYLLSARVTGAKSVLSYIADRSTHGAYRQTDGSLFAVNCEKDGNIFFDRHHLPVVNRMTEADHERVQYPIGKNTHVLKGYSYTADTVNGDCGSILMQHNVRLNQKILGVHVAAQTGLTRCFSELLVQEEVQDAIAELSKRTNYITTGSVLQTVELAKRHAVMAQGSIPNQFRHLNENIDIFGVVPQSMVKRTPEKTEILPSPLQGYIDIEPKTEPAPLTVKDPRCLSGIDPLIYQVGGYGLESKPFRRDQLELIKEHQINKLRKYNGFIGRRTLSLKESINGIPGIDYADAMNMNSAEGSFWNLNRPFWAHNKSWMFENMAPEGERANYKIRMDSGLLQKLIHRLQEAQAGRRVLSTSSECLKDERRPFKKTRPPPELTDEEKSKFTPGTRSFTILPVDYNILVRQYFWDFAAMIMSNRNELSAQVGIDPCSIEWTGLIKRLLATSTKGFAGDYKNYDRQTPAEFMDLACDIINGWYDDGPVNAQVRKVLMGEAFDHLSIVRGVYIHIDKGLPSGFPLTVIVNCLNNDTYKYISWLNLAPPHMLPLDCCDENVDSAFYGDDNMHAITAAASGFWNMRTVGKFLGEHGVELTDEHKNKWFEAPELVDIETCSFLKRLFVKHKESGLYRAPLEKRSIEDRLLWITDSKFMDAEELLAENIKNSLRDAFQWGPGYFLELKDKIVAALGRRYTDNPQLQRMLISDITYGGEELRWISTCKYMDQMNSHPVLRDVFGF